LPLHGALPIFGVAWKMQPPPAPAGTVPSAEARLLAGEADAMTREYQAALLEVQAGRTLPPPPAAVPALEELDRSALQSRDGLEEAPGARYLLDRLRRTYATRLERTRRRADRRGSTGGPTGPAPASPSPSPCAPRRPACRCPRRRRSPRRGRSTRAAASPWTTSSDASRCGPGTATTCRSPAGSAMVSR